MNDIYYKNNNCLNFLKGRNFFHLTSTQTIATCQWKCFARVRARLLWVYAAKLSKHQQPFEQLRLDDFPIRPTINNFKVWQNAVRKVQCGWQRHSAWFSAKRSPLVCIFFELTLFATDRWTSCHAFKIFWVGEMINFVQLIVGKCTCNT